MGKSWCVCSNMELNMTQNINTILFSKGIIASIMDVHCLHNHEHSFSSHSASWESFLPVIQPRLQSETTEGLEVDLECLRSGITLQGQLVHNRRPPNVYAREYELRSNKTLRRITLMWVEVIAKNRQQILLQSRCYVENSIESRENGYSYHHVVEEYCSMFFQ